MNSIKSILLIVSLSILAACGGGGGGGDDTQPAGTVINGVASKGIITSGTVTVFALNADGSKGVQLGTGSTDGSGAYSIPIGSYAGPVMVEAYGGYTDEATGLPMTVPAGAPLRAGMANASGAVSLSVTPLTDLAVRQAGILTSQNIITANALISDLFKVDISSTPAAPTAGAFQASTTTQTQKDYALVLAAVSQQMKTGGADLATTLATLNSGISPAGMNQATAAAITTAVSDFIANTNNRTGVTSVAGTSLQTIGATTMKLTIALQGSTATSVKGFLAAIKFPSGVTLRADLAGALLNGAVTLTPNAPSGYVEGKYFAVGMDNQATVNLGYMSSGNLAAGDMLIINADLAPGVAAPTAEAFTCHQQQVGRCTWECCERSLLDNTVSIAQIITAVLFNLRISKAFSKQGLQIRLLELQNHSLAWLRFRYVGVLIKNIQK